MSEESTVIAYHQPCPDCGSHDALCKYSDGHTYCFSCHTFHKQEGDDSGYMSVRPDMIPESMMTIDDLRARGITKTTCEKFGYYKARVNGQWAQVACYYDDTGRMVGQKIRFQDKQFSVRGHVTHRFFGQQRWAGGGGKKLIITEGEIDCLTVSQVNGNKYPVVSIPNGVTSAKAVFKDNLEWLDSFEQVIVMFDNDEAGREAVKSVEGLLKPNKLFVATLPLKDPNECLLAGRADEINKAIWSAKQYTPDGIINAKDTWDIISVDDDNEKGYEYPWNIDLNKMTMGLRKGELTVLTAGTGVGKSTFVRGIAYDLGVNKGLKVGMLMLEENIKRTVKGLMSIACGKRLYINRQCVSDEEYKDAFDKTAGSGNYVLYEHFGSLDGDNLLDKIRYMAIGEQCDFIILDHVSIAVSGLEGNDERKLIDILMTTMRSLVEETGVGLIVISHLKRVSDQQSHEEGGATSLSQLRGSGAIAQLADTVIGLERNQQADGKEKNLVRVRVLKNRFTGETGIAGYLYYDKDTDHLEAVERVSDFISEEKEDKDNDCPF
jgi:twinkle protein